MQVNPFIKIAVAIIINDKNQLLTVQKFGSTYYQLPGGKIEANEKPIESLLRELQEELNLVLQEDDCQFMAVHEAQAVNEQGKTVRGFIFKINLKEEFSDLKVQAELKELLWLDKTAIEDVKLANLLKQFALPIWLEE